jgi:hypothetical protein
MRRAFAVVLMGVALTLLSARPASAQWSWFRWIQELSGPGDFELNGTTVTFGCVKPRNPTQVTEDRPEVGGQYMYLFCDKGRDWRQVKRFMGATFAVGDGTNPLVYPSTVEKLERVKGQLYLGTGGFRLNSYVDVGASGGFMRFAGAREDRRDVWVTKYLVEPYIAVRPLAFLADDDNQPLDRVARAVEFNAALIVFPQGFRLSDFGAIGGTEFSGNPETIVRFGFRATFVF